MRTSIPDSRSTTDFIVGFPGETEDDFRETLEVVEEVGYDGAFTFVDSPRAGTEAAAMPEQVPDELKRERIEQLVEVVQRVAAERNADRIGVVEEVLVEGPSRASPTLCAARTPTTPTSAATPLQIVSVAIVSATSTTLAGAQLALAAA